MSKKTRSVESKESRWDTGDLGRSLEHAEVVDDGYDSTIDEALQLQMISIRLEKGLIESLKFIAARNKGIGYQPLIRQVLHRFATAEINHIAREMKLKDDRETERVGPIDAPEGVKAA